MSSLFKKIKSINQWEKDLVIGYTKKAQKLVKPNQIPTAISYLCLVYYYQYDYFVFGGNKIDGIHINDKNDTVTVIDDGVGSSYVYGIMSISDEIPLIYRWTFKLLNKGEEFYNDLAIGISNETDSEHDYYRIFSQGEKDSLDSLAEYAQLLNSGDVIIMEVNVKNGEMRYYVNDKDHGIAFENIDFKKNKYKMEICVGDKGFEIKLIDFTKIKCTI